MDNINLDDYNYILPKSRIADFPLDERDQSKLLLYNKGKISHQSFNELKNFLPVRSLLVFNNTKVIPARIHFRKTSGALIEILLLQPVKPSRLVPVIMEAKNEVIWECMVRNFRKWKDKDVLTAQFFSDAGKFNLMARIEDRDKIWIKFWWDNNALRFINVIESSGKTPLPPYIKREPDSNDKIRYQTVYSEENGAVAAPTAGLHFTKKMLDELNQVGHTLDYMTLHVSAGTFLPIKEADITEHTMHSEQIVIKRNNLENLIRHHHRIIPVGTTSMRILESIYWYGVKLMLSGDKSFKIEKLYPYTLQNTALPDMLNSFTAVFDYMKREESEVMIGETELFIIPGYKFRVCDGLITNYHMPRSTLILLVAAFVGNDWRKIYREALEHDYRFLSYGDTSLLLP